ncbi:hypothetical protein [Coraliomargarita sinensis]|nr:hypothetical protein [Coraliomargarita sinensis]
MNHLVTTILLISPFLVSCTNLAPEAETKDPDLLFEDSMTKDWRDHWFLDGKEATLEHRDGGLYFAAGTVTKQDDPVAYHAHHAVLWTRQVFEGDIKISYELTRIDDSDYGTTLLYVQAQGIGEGRYQKDLTKWNDFREIPAMDKYFKYMDLISLSFRENLRCKRYPWMDSEGEWYEGRGLIKPMVDYTRMQTGETYRVEVEKRADSLKLRLEHKGSGKILLDHTWDLTQVAGTLEPQLIEKGRIGLRHMATRQFIYRDFKVKRLQSHATH